MTNYSLRGCKVSQDPELARVDIEIAGRSISVGLDVVGSIAFEVNAAGNSVISEDRNIGSSIGDGGNVRLTSPKSPPPAPMASAAPKNRVLVSYWALP